MSISRRRFFAMGALGGAAALGFWRHFTTDSAAAAPLAENLKSCRRSSFALGCEVSILALHENEARAREAVAAAFTELRTVEELMSLYLPESQLCRLNRTGELAGPHPYMLEILRKAQAVSEQTHGGFDVTVQPLWDLYHDAQQRNCLPDASAVAAARARADWRQLEVGEDCVRLRRPDMSVTLNGIAQGFAADKVAAALRKHGVSHALIDTGEIGTLGTRENRQPWRVGIQDPRKPDAFAALTALAGRCLATSGDYETVFTPDFKFNHIFDPATGASPLRFSSVTVIAPSGLDADALSTAIFVVGFDQGRKLIANIPGAEMYCIHKDGSVRMTPGFPKIENT